MNIMLRSKYLFAFILLLGFHRLAMADIHIIPRPEKIIQGEGTFELNAKTIVVADETTKHEIAKSAIIYFWKGSLDLVNKAVSNGYEVVNSYHAQTYLDYDFTAIPLSKAYAFDPISEGLDPRFNSKILGSGCQMWSEWIPTVKQMELQVFPRLAAYAEVGWTTKTEKDYDIFLKSLSELKKRWDMLGINYTICRDQKK